MIKLHILWHLPEDLTVSKGFQGEELLGDREPFK